MARLRADEIISASERAPSRNCRPSETWFHSGMAPRVRRPMSAMTVIISINEKPDRFRAATELAVRCLHGIIGPFILSFYERLTRAQRRAIELAGCRDAMPG